MWWSKQRSRTHNDVNIESMPNSVGTRPENLFEGINLAAFTRESNISRGNRGHSQCVQVCQAADFGRNCSRHRVQIKTAVVANQKRKKNSTLHWCESEILQTHNSFRRDKRHTWLGIEPCSWVLMKLLSTCALDCVCLDRIKRANSQPGQCGQRADDARESASESSPMNVAAVILVNEHEHSSSTIKVRTWQSLRCSRIAARDCWSQRNSGLRRIEDTLYCCNLMCSGTGIWIWLFFYFSHRGFFFFFVWGKPISV